MTILPGGVCASRNHGNIAEVAERSEDAERIRNELGDLAHRLSVLRELRVLCD
jgi:hypothetical protein